MANIIVALVTVALIMVGALTVATASLSSASNISESFERQLRRAGEVSRTKLELIEADTVGSGTRIDIPIRNAGQTALADFGKWDVVIRYYATSGNEDLRIERLTYTTSDPPADGQWTVEGIYLDAEAGKGEVFDPDIFNPGEELVVRITVDPEIPVDTDNVVTIVTANGVSLSAPFTR